MEYYTAFSTQATPMVLNIHGAGSGSYSPPSSGSSVMLAHREIGDLTNWGFPYYVDVFASSFVGLSSAGFTLNFDSTTLKYTLSRAGGFNVNFISDNAINAMYALGFTASLSGAASYTSHVIPYYVIRPVIEARSADSDVYEPDDLTEEAISDGGMAYPVSKDSNELLRDWTQAMEPNTSTLIRDVDATKPWTWQHFFKHLREGGYPFAVTDINAVYFLRAEGTAFNQTTRTRQVADWQSLWNINFKTRELDGYVLP